MALLIPLLIAGAAAYSIYNTPSDSSGTHQDVAANPGIESFSKAPGPYTDPTLELVVGNPLLRTSNKQYHVPKGSTFVYGQWGIPRIDMGTQRGQADSILIFANPGGDISNPLRHY